MVQHQEGSDVERAQVVIPCTDFDTTLSFFTTELGFRVDRISPADDPAAADLSGHGLNLLLERGEANHDGTLVLHVAADDHTAGIGVGDAFGSGARHAPDRMLTAPNGTAIRFVPATREMHLPPIVPSLVISRVSESEAFAAGRAGMGYRDLIPNRQGGRFIASHIRIEGGGEVPDYAHFHKIRFQIIYCYKGWVRLVYEDQGEPFVLHAGDCVLQPPEIRHRVLESSEGLEVIEIGCPAEHDTYADHEISLPTDTVDPLRDFGGQRFVHHVASTATWVPSRLDGFDCRHVGIAQATDGLAGVRVLRPHGPGTTDTMVHDAEFLFLFVLEGHLDLVLDGEGERLVAGDSVVIPAGMAHQVGPSSADAAVLEVSLPAVVPLA